mmetsp:Transcript_10668/g.24755  ORF Transcript_10668/g.24755 Transcript_10668/m.24755 type:complete len:91 (-) Transcript_10668:508-780(-)
MSNSSQNSILFRLVFHRGLHTIFGHSLSTNRDKFGYIPARPRGMIRKERNFVLQTPPTAVIDDAAENLNGPYSSSLFPSREAPPSNLEPL